MPCKQSKSKSKWISQRKTNPAEQKLVVSEKIKDMSLGYAEKLSYREDVGSVGMSEIFDPPHLLQQKVYSFFVQTSCYFFACSFFVLALKFCTFLCFLKFLNLKLM